ncbi:MAG: hypothetical protein HN952_06965 [Candidatus Cloacimonetes bacterium]|nr:hypothetical protein [Candidatus Cloacimonadota bacterium]MBT6994675.1 hypothetical protein [Candidatus Cloacimonadota bacterium]MBT7469489.1 hypothetical protein [Candidatus Cloacimonadota bacterium]
MRENLRILVEMQKIDDVIGEKNKLVEELPKKLNSMIGNQKNATELVDETKEKINECKSTQKLKDLDIQNNHGKMNKYKNQLLDIKTNREYKALNSEITHLENKNSTIDDEILELMETEADLQNQLAAAIKKLQLADDDLRLNEEKLKKEIEDVKIEIKTLRNNRNEMAKKLPIQIVKRYAVLLKNKNRRAVVFNENNVCGGCGYKLRPQIILEIKEGGKLLFCENCGRIITHKNFE